MNFWGISICSTFGRHLCRKCGRVGSKLYEWTHIAETPCFCIEKSDSKLRSVSQVHFIISKQRIFSNVLITKEKLLRYLCLNMIKHTCNSAFNCNQVFEQKTKGINWVLWHYHVTIFCHLFCHVTISITSKNDYFKSLFPQIRML